MKLPLPRALVLGAAGLLFATALSTGQQGAEVFSLERVSGRVHVLYGRGGNIALFVGAEGVLMVDDQFAQLAEGIEAQTRSLSDAPLRYVVNTHWHGDHSGSNAYFGERATVVAHHNVRRRLAGDEPPMEAAGLPAITYGEDLSLHLNGEEVHLIHLPTAHTDGDTAVWFPGSKVAHLGDLYFQSGFPFIDAASGGKPETYLAAIEELLRRLPGDTMIIPGHGRVSDMEGLREYRDMLAETQRRVRDALALGKTAADMMAVKLFEDLDARWGQGFISSDGFITLLAQNMAQE